MDIRTLGQQEKLFNSCEEINTINQEREADERANSGVETRPSLLPLQHYRATVELEHQVLQYNVLVIPRNTQAFIELLRDALELPAIDETLSRELMSVLSSQEASIYCRDDLAAQSALLLWQKHFKTSVPVPFNAKVFKEYLNSQLSLESISFSDICEISQIFSSNILSKKHIDNNNRLLMVQLWFRMLECSLILCSDQKQREIICDQQQKALNDYSQKFNSQTGLVANLVEMIDYNLKGGKETIQNAILEDLPTIISNSTEKERRRQLVFLLAGTLCQQCLFDDIVSYFFKNQEACKQAMLNLNVLINETNGYFFSQLFPQVEKMTSSRASLDWLVTNIDGFTCFRFLPSVADEKKRLQRDLTKTEQEILDKNKTSAMYDANSVIARYEILKKRLFAYAVADDDASVAFTRSALESHVDKQLCQLLEIEKFFFIELVVNAHRNNVEAPLYHYIHSFYSPEYTEPFELHTNWLIVLSGELDFIKRKFYANFQKKKLWYAFEACIAARLCLHRACNIGFEVEAPAQQEQELLSSDDGEILSSQHVQEFDEKEQPPGIWSERYKRTLRSGMALDALFINQKNPQLKDHPVYIRALTKLIAEYYIEPLYVYAQKWNDHASTLAKLSSLIYLLDHSQLRQLCFDWRFVFFFLMWNAHSRSANNQKGTAGSDQVNRYFCEQLAGCIKDYISEPEREAKRSWIHHIFRLEKLRHLEPGCKLEDIRLFTYIKVDNKDPLVAYVSSLLQDETIKQIFDYLCPKYVNKIFQYSGIEIGFPSKILRLQRTSQAFRDDFRLEASQLMCLTEAEQTAWEKVLKEKNSPRHQSQFRAGLERRHRLYTFLDHNDLLSICRDDDYLRFLIAYTCFYFAKSITEQAAFEKAVFLYRLLKQFDELASGGQGFLKQTYALVLMFFPAQPTGQLVMDFRNNLYNDHMVSRVINLLPESVRNGFSEKKIPLQKIDRIAQINSLMKFSEQEDAAFKAYGEATSVEILRNGFEVRQSLFIRLNSTESKISDDYVRFSLCYRVFYFLSQNNIKMAIFFKVLLDNLDDLESNACLLQDIFANSLGDESCSSDDFDVCWTTVFNDPETLQTISLLSERALEYSLIKRDGDRSLLSVYEAKIVTDRPAQSPITHCHFSSFRPLSPSVNEPGSSTQVLSQHR